MTEQRTIPKEVLETLVALVDETATVTSLKARTAVGVAKMALDSSPDTSILDWAEVRPAVLEHYRRTINLPPGQRAALAALIDILTTQFARFSLDLSASTAAVPALVTLGALRAYSADAVAAGHLTADHHEWLDQACGALSMAISSLAPLEIRT